MDPKHNSERDNYKLLIGTVIPRPIAFVTTQSEDGILNGAPFSYFNIVSSNPPMVSLSIQRPLAYGLVKPFSKFLILSNPTASQGSNLLLVV